MSRTEAATPAFSATLACTAPPARAKPLASIANGQREATEYEYLRLGQCTVVDREARI